MNHIIYLKKLARTFIPLSIKRRINYYRIYFSSINLYSIKKSHRQRIKYIQIQNKVKVLFLAGELAMWRYQTLYDILSKDPRFELMIAISIPAIREKTKTALELEKYFKSLNMPYINSIEIDTQFFLSQWNPDIIFYCQPYESSLLNAFDCNNNLHRLLAYVPYGLSTVNWDFTYNGLLHNCAWRIYQASSLHFKTAKSLCANYGKNIVVVGEPHADIFLSPTSRNPWKQINDNKIRKKIIWAPHASVNKNSLSSRGAFLWLYKAMLEIAHNFSDKIQIAFKPHPYLYTNLSDIWGEKRVNEYYNYWKNGFNTQLETEDFIDLFKNSDALIHDCGSFTGEYLFTGNPVMFTTKTFDIIRTNADDFGLECLKGHYIGNTVDDVMGFIYNIIQNGPDPLKIKRNQIKKQYLTPPNGLSVAQNIYNDLVNSLFK